MTATAVVSVAERLGIVLIPRDGNIRYRGPKGTLTPEFRAALVEHKPAILALLGDCGDGEPWQRGMDVRPPAWRIEVAGWPHDWWARWRARSGERKAEFGGGTLDPDWIGECDLWAYVETCVAIDREAAATWQARWDADPDLATEAARDLAAGWYTAQIGDPASGDCIGDPALVEPWRAKFYAWDPIWKQKWVDRVEELEGDAAPAAVHRRAFLDIQARMSDPESSWWASSRPFVTVPDPVPTVTP